MTGSGREREASAATPLRGPASMLVEASSVDDVSDGMRGSSTWTLGLYMLAC